MKHLLILIIAFAGISSSAIAKGKSSKEIRGDKYYFVYSFDKAIDSYMKAKQLSVEGQRRLADSYHNMSQCPECEMAYAKLITMPGGNLPNDYFNYAMVLKLDGKTAQSNTTMDKFSELYPNDLRAKDYVAHKDELADMSKDNGNYLVQHLNFNTDAEDFGPSYYKNQIVFASSRGNGKLNERKYNWNGKPFLNLYVSDVEEHELKNPAIFDKSLDGKMHDGPASFSQDGKFIAFTRNNYDTKRKDKVVVLQICFSTFTDGKWSKPESFILNNPAYSVGHPCLTADGNTMYFTSDMPGGFGGADIYRITKDDKGTWGKPENLGDKINTEGDELFPFYDETNKILFFSSNGRFGLGGLDIFICTANGSEFGKVYNAGTPLNTTADDFGAVLNADLSKGYFSSNRTGGSGDDDIYSFDVLKLNVGKRIDGFAKEVNGNIVPNTFVTLLDDKGNILNTITTKDDGAYSFFVDANKNYKLTGTKINYREGDNVVNTTGNDVIYNANVILLKEEKIVAEKIEVNSDLGKIAELKPIYFDYNKYNIRPDAATELDKIIKIMNENPTLVVELSSYTDCRGTVGYNQKLSDRRAASSVAYIKNGITNPDRISGKGYSETKAVNSCACEDDHVSTCSEAEYQENRRSEFIVKKK